MNKYIIVTAAYNEQDYIEFAIKSVIRQTVKPVKWIIVDDGSTDGTADIIKKYQRKYDFIEYHLRERDADRPGFCSNTYAIRSGYEKTRDADFDHIAILDADITLPDDYYQRILDKFQQDDKLATAGGIYQNLIDGKLCNVINDRRSVPKAIQVFRKEIFEKIDGYMPLKYGGEDTVSCFMVRQMGFKAWSFENIKVVHHRPTGTRNTKKIFAVRFRQGIGEYCLATQPIFYMGKIIKRMVKEKPYFIGSIVRLSGFIWAAVRRYEIVLPRELVKFIRTEQLKRALFLNRIAKK